MFDYSKYDYRKIEKKISGCFARMPILSPEGYQDPPGYPVVVGLYGTLDSQNIRPEEIEFIKQWYNQTDSEYELTADWPEKLIPKYPGVKTSHKNGYLILRKYAASDVTENDYGETLCGKCGAVLICNECGDMPEECPVCKCSLSYRLYGGN